MMTYYDVSDNNSTNDLEERWKVQAALIDTQTSDDIVTDADSPFTEWAKVGFPSDMFELTPDDIVAITNVYTSPVHQPITQMSIVSLNNSSIEEPSIKNEEGLFSESELEDSVLPGVPSVEQATARDGFRETTEIVEYGISWISDNIRPDIRFSKRLYNKHYINSKRRRKSKPYNRNYLQLSSSDEYADAMQRVNQIEMPKCKPHEYCCAYKSHTNNMQINTTPSGSSGKISNSSTKIPSSQEMIVSKDKTSSSSKDVLSVNLAAAHEEYVNTLRIPKSRKKHNHKRNCVHGSHHKYKHTSRLYKENISTGLAPLLSELITEIKTTRLYLQKQKQNKQEPEDLISSTESCESISDLAPPPTSTSLNNQYSNVRDNSYSSNGFSNSSLISEEDNWGDIEISKSSSVSSRSALPLAISHKKNTEICEFRSDPASLPTSTNLKSECSDSSDNSNSSIGFADPSLISVGDNLSNFKVSTSLSASSRFASPLARSDMNDTDSSDYDNNEHYLLQSNIKSLRSSYEKSINNQIGRENISDESWNSEEFLGDTVTHFEVLKSSSESSRSDFPLARSHKKETESCESRSDPEPRPTSTTLNMQYSDSNDNSDSSDYDNNKHFLLQSNIKSLRSTYEKSINNHIVRENITNDDVQTLSCDSEELFGDYYQTPTRPFSSNDQSEGSTTHFDVSKSSSASSSDPSDYDNLEHVLLKSSIKSMRSTYEESINNQIGRRHIANDYDKTLSWDSGEFRDKNYYKTITSHVRSDDQGDQRTHLSDNRKSTFKRLKTCVDDISHNSTTVSSTETVSTNGNEEVKKSPVVGSFWNTVDPLGLSSSLQQPLITTAFTEPRSTTGGFRMPDTPRPNFYDPQPGLYSYWEGISANNEDISLRPELKDTIQYPYTSEYCTDESSTAEESMSPVELTEEETRREIRNIVQTIASIRQQETVLSQSMISLREERWYFEGKLCDLLEKPIGSTNSCTYLQNNELRSHCTRVTSPPKNHCNNTPAIVEFKLPVAKQIVSSDDGIFQNVGQKTDSSEVINFQQYPSPDAQAFNFLIPDNVS